MKPINNKLHGIFDYVTVALFLVLPTILQFSEVPTLVSYALAIMHLLLTMLTRFEGGYLKILEVKIHEILESMAGIILLAVPWIFRFDAETDARWSFMAMGVFIIVVGHLSQYKES